mmetsp:Transcript_13883/g.29637  ORF Transcript_13883/g.29637 Transcript_13883/m.29637 type:complete len:116 (+) Transcript_13883:284-631(+)
MGLVSTQRKKFETNAGSSLSSSSTNTIPLQRRSPMKTIIHQQQQQHTQTSEAEETTANDKTIISVAQKWNSQKQIRQGDKKDGLAARKKELSNDEKIDSLLSLLDKPVIAPRRKR